MFNYEILELLNSLAMIFPAMIVVFTFRGFFKALVAKWMGDDTAYKYGFVSLNPAIHIHIIRLFIMLFVLFFIGGLSSGIISRVFIVMIFVLFGAGSSIPVPINEANFKNHTLGVILTTLVAPFGGFLVALFFMYLVKYFPANLFPLYVYKSFVEVFSVIIEFCVFFGVLDLLPIPPFDGGRLLKVVLPRPWQGAVNWLEQYSIYIFLFLFFAPVISNYFLGFIHLLALLIRLALSFLLI